MSGLQAREKAAFRRQHTTEQELDRDWLNARPLCTTRILRKLRDSSEDDDGKKLDHRTIGADLRRMRCA